MGLTLEIAAQACRRVKATRISTQNADAAKLGDDAGRIRFA
jgi:hypothetical protein